MNTTTTMPRPATATTGLVLLAGIALALFAATSSAATGETPVRGDTEAERLGFEIAARADRSDRGFGNSEVELEMVLRNRAGKEARRQSGSAFGLLGHEFINRVRE